MLKYFFIMLAFLVLVVLAMAGFRGQKSGQPPIEIFPDMDRQPKVKPQTPSEFYADGRAARPPVDGTVPLGYAMPMHKLVDGSVGQATGPYKQIIFSSSPGYLDTGKMGENWGTGIPFEISLSDHGRGQQRFGIYCAVCHGATGAGNGIAQKFGLNTVQSLLQDRIRVMSDGEIFNTISHGKNTMMGYGDRIQVIDRWAIIAYLRALQKSQGRRRPWPTCLMRSALNWSPNSMSQPFSDEPQPEFFDYKHVGGRFLGLIGMAVVALCGAAGRGLLRFEAVCVLLSVCLHVFPYDLHGRTCSGRSCIMRWMRSGV